MNRLLSGALLLITLSALLTDCRKKAFDEYYGRPDNLQPPIYQVLTAKGNFKSLLAVIDKSGYKDILTGSGSFTMFAPNDAAFQKFFADRGITGPDQVDSGTAKQIVTFSLVYNAFLKVRLADYQSSAGWVPNISFRRRTTNYTGFYSDSSWNGTKYTALASNRNNTSGTNYFVLGDNNNKYITYFLDNYLSAKHLTSADYNYFYPNTPYKGFNVADATVVTPDIVAENGYIEETDKVLLPFPTVDQYLASNPQYSEFKKLFDKYMVQYILNSSASDRYKLLTGNTANVYIKSFNPGLAFSPNNENYLKAQDNDGQSDGYTLFVPKNDVLLNYINTVLLEKYSSLDQMPLQIIIDFINAHMWQTCVWPSKFANTNNIQGEPARFDASADIVDKKILSNGFFYGTSKVQQANVFSTVYGKPYLDPGYLLMTRALDQNYRYTITIPTLKFTIFMMSDQLLRSWGYDWNVTRNEWQYTAPGTTTVTTGGVPLANLQRILATHIVPTPNNELDNITGSGFIETINGEYIKYNAGKIYSVGALDSGFTVNTTGTKTAINGRVYYTDNLLVYTSKTIGNAVKLLGSASTSDFNFFYQYLFSSTNFTASTGTFNAGVPIGGYYTLFIPNNAAIQAAVTAGLLPKMSTGAPNFAPTTIPEQDLVNNFIKYHFINKNTVIPDGRKTGSFETIYRKNNGDPGVIKVISTPGSMQLADDYGRTANVIMPGSNNMADRCMIHLIDNYLQYNPN